MLVTMTVIFCSLASDVCVDRLITDSNLDSRLTMASCALGQAGLPDYMAKDPALWSGWRVAKIRCTIGNPPKKVPA